MSSADRASRIVWVTASGTALDHAVTPRNVRFGVAAKQIGVCGAEFRAAPLVADPGRHCVACIRCIAAGGIQPSPEHGRAEIDDDPIARWWQTFWEETPVDSLRTPGATPSEATGYRVRWDSATSVPSILGSEFHRTPDIDPDRTQRTHPVAHLFRASDDTWLPVSGSLHEAAACF